MRAFSFIAIIIIISTVFYSCGEVNQPTAEELMEGVEEAFGNELHVCRYIYKKSAKEFSRSYLSNELAGIIYYGVKLDHMWELELMSDYAVRLADDESGCEIHIFKVRAKSDVDTVEKLLRRRLDYMKNRSIYIYIPEDYEKNISSAEVYTIGNYVFFLATPDNQKAYGVIKDMIDQ
ncbi:MAG: DUF4358 domain-containing protein [Ruminococcaceae bacterium]|nr:DUF4358 domain-containing protein [Oscillospiraceae bacterium]